MAITFTLTNQEAGGKAPSASLFADRVLVAFDSTYTTGGDVVDFAAAIGKGRTILFVPDQLLSDGRLAVYDRVNKKVQVFEFPDAKGPATEIDNATDLSGVTAEILVLSE